MAREDKGNPASMGGRRKALLTGRVSCAFVYLIGCRVPLQRRVGSMSATPFLCVAFPGLTLKHLKESIHYNMKISASTLPNRRPLC